MIKGKRSEKKEKTGEKRNKGRKREKRKNREKKNYDKIGFFWGKKDIFSPNLYSTYLGGKKYNFGWAGGGPNMICGGKKKTL